MAKTDTSKPYLADFEQFYPIWSEYPEGQEQKGLKELMEASQFPVKELEFVQRSFHFDSIGTLLSKRRCFI